MHIHDHTIPPSTKSTLAFVVGQFFPTVKQLGFAGSNFRIGMEIISKVPRCHAHGFFMFTVYPTQARNPACLGVCELIQQIHLFHLVLGQIGVPGIPGYPLVNIQKTMENHHFQWENPL